MDMALKPMCKSDLQQWTPNEPWPAQLYAGGLQGSHRDNQ